MGRMEALDDFRGVFEVFFRLPSPINTIGVTFPFYEVLEFSSEHTRVKDLLNFIFFFIIYEHVLRSFRKLLTGEGGFFVRAKKSFIGYGGNFLPSGW